MKIDRAKKNFGEIEGPLQTKPVKFYRFKFEHCWVLLKDSPKWENRVLIRNNAPKKQPDTISFINLSDTLNTPLSSNTTNIPDDIPNRPEGRRKSKDKEKEKRKRDDQEDESTTCLKSINYVLQETAIMQREKWEAKKKRMLDKELAQDMKIMSQAMVGFTAEQVAYFKFQQSMVIQRQKERGLLPSFDTGSEY